MTTKKKCLQNIEHPKFLLITPGKLGYLPANYAITDKIDWIYNENLFHSNIFLKEIKRIGINFSLGLQFWYPWTKRIIDYDMIIIFDTKNAPMYVKYINKKFPDKKIVVWYANTVGSTVSPNTFDGLNCELWSFDAEDCLKYGLKWNTQFYQYVYDLPKKSVSEYDIVFVGQDKGRLQYLLAFADICKEENIRVDLNVINIKTSKKNSFIYSNYIPYSDIITKYYGRSTSILDIQKEGQSGITLRPLESIFYKKKLITNNADIIKYDFYHPNNIFVLDERIDCKSLKKFLYLPYQEIERDIVKRYTTESWVQRFLN